MEITRLDFSQVTGRIGIEMLDVSMQDIGDDVVIVTSLFHIHLPDVDHILSRKSARLVLDCPAPWLRPRPPASP